MAHVIAPGSSVASASTQRPTPPLAPILGPRRTSAAPWTLPSTPATAQLTSRRMPALPLASPPLPRGHIRASAAAPRPHTPQPLNAAAPARVAETAAAPEATTAQSPRHVIPPRNGSKASTSGRPFPATSNSGPGTVASYEDEYILQPGAPLPPLQAQIARLEAIMERVQQAETMEQKVEVLRGVDSVAAFAAEPRHAPVCAALECLPPAQQFVLLALPAMLQAHALQEPEGAPPSPPAALAAKLAELASRLARVEAFYDSVGGLLGYQARSLGLIMEGLQEKAARRQQQAEPHPVSPASSPSSPASSPSSSSPSSSSSRASPASSIRSSATNRYHVPRGADLAGEAGAGVGVSAAAAGLAALPYMAEIYPVGGAGDRLGLVDEATGEPLPAAMLPYAGRSLLECLIRDLQAREYLYARLTGRQVTTPLAIMTSDAKGNHGRVAGLLAQLNWAGRGREAFRLFRQPLVPVVAVEDGRWLLSRPMGPMMKPGGHGAIWKLMWDEGVFDWLSVRHGRSAAIVRQISNPMAGVDTTLLALAGAGFTRAVPGGGGGEAFGFMSCERAVGAAEGMNVLQERKRWEEGQGGAPGRWVYEYGVTNVEYTEFEKLGLSDEAVGPGSSTSVFPANTNVLYVGLRAAQRVVAEAISKRDGRQLLPGLIFNLNKKLDYVDPLGGGARQVTAGRMESTMQNLADYLADAFEGPQDPGALAQGGRLSTFLVSNLRRKVTSSAKKRRPAGSARIAQTPDGSFYDLQRNAWQVLQRCGLTDVPEPGSPEQYLAKGPGFIFLFHPALGPLWDVIAQKVLGGSMTHGSELVLEVAEARLVGTKLDGSLQIVAENVMGHMEQAAPYSQQHQGGAAATNGSNGGANGSAAANGPAADSVLSVSSLTNGTTELQLQPPPANGHAAPADASPPAAAPSATPSPGAPALLRYSHRCGRVQMVNVAVRNAGIDWQAPGNVYWKHQVARRESCQIILQGQSEFEARDVTLTGSHTFVVPDGHRMSLSPAHEAHEHPAAGGGSGNTGTGPGTATVVGSGAHAFVVRLTPLRRAPHGGGGYAPSWEWRYGMDEQGAVRLSYVVDGFGGFHGGGGLGAAAEGGVGAMLALAERRAQGVLDFVI